MPQDKLAELRTVWAKNDELLRNLTSHLERIKENGGIPQQNQYQGIVGLAFGRALETFSAVQHLCNPNQSSPFWVDGFVLTRTLFETWLTLLWIEQESTDRGQRFDDDFRLKQAHILERLTSSKRPVSPDEQEMIFRARNEVVTRRCCAPGKIRLMPGVEKMVKELASKVAAQYPDLEWEYEVYYRYASGFSHLSGWSMTAVQVEQGKVFIQSPPREGLNALRCGGLWFFRLLIEWNKAFGVLDWDVVEKWLKEWSAALPVREKKSSSHQHRR